MKEIPKKETTPLYTHQSTKHHPPHVPLLYTNLYNFSLIKFFQLKKKSKQKNIENVITHIFHPTHKY